MFSFLEWQRACRFKYNTYRHESNDKESYYICCRMMYCSNSDLKNEAQIDYENWSPLILDKQIMPLLVPEPSTFAASHSRPIDIQQIFNLESMRAATLLTQVNKEKNIINRPLPSVKLSYSSGYEYMRTFMTLVEEEMIMDKMQKESFAQHGIKVDWGLSLRKKRIATFIFPSSEELGPSWFIGNQLRLKLGDDWSGKGVGLKITDGNIKAYLR